MPKVLHQTAGWCHTEGHDKVWAAAVYDDGSYRVKWGKRGTALQYKTTPFPTVSHALAKYNEVVMEKITSGPYQEIRFDRDIKAPGDKVRSFEDVEDNQTKIRLSSSFQDLT